MKKFMLLGMVVMGLSACSSQPVDEVEVANEEGVKVVTTIAPLYSLTANLVEGSEVELENLVPINSSVHTFALTPSKAASVAEADLVIMNGLELEEFLEDFIEEEGDVVVNASEGIEAAAYEEEGHEEEHEDHDDHEGHDHDTDSHDGHEGHNHGEFDPHVWLSPELARVQASNIAEALMEVDPENAELYASNLEVLEGRLEELGSKGKVMFEGKERKSYLVFHDAYHYLEEFLGVEASGHLEEFPGKQPSAQYLAELSELIEEEGIEVLFAEPQFAPKLAEVLVEDYDLEIGTLDPLGQSLSKDGYFEMWEGNLRALEILIK